MPAIELAQLLKKPDDFFARTCRAVEPFRFQRTDEFKAQLQRINRESGVSPSRQEDLRKALHEAARAAQHAAWRRDRDETYWWLKLLRLYAASRDWLLPLDPKVRANFVKAQWRQIEKFARNYVAPSSKEEGRRRARNRTELGRHHKRLRQQYGWRGAADGRTTRLSAAVGGVFDAAEVAKREAELLFAKPATGVSVENIDPMLSKAMSEIENEPMSEDDRKADALTDLLHLEEKKFMRKKNGTTH